MRRASKRSEPDRFERERSEFFENVRAAYRQLAVNDAKRCKLIDASLALPQVQQQIATELIGI